MQPTLPFFSTPSDRRPDQSPQRCLVIGLLLSVLLAGCGGASQADTERNGTPGSIAEPAENPSVDTPLHDGGDGDTPHADGGMGGGGQPTAPGLDAGHPFDSGPPPVTSTCGDDVCDASEGCSLCPADCGACPTSCTPGFELAGDACVPLGEEALTLRGEADVCAHFASEHVDVGPEWAANDNDTSPCAPGQVPEAAQQNGIRRVNLYRWLVGLAPVTEATALLDNQQACAVLMHDLGTITHNPPSDATCYSAAGAGAAGSSNLAYGAGLADSVDLYVADNGVASLGHRRWVLNPRMGETAFGFIPNYSCMYSFSQNGAGTTLPYVSWPPAGYVPLDAARGRYSLTLFADGFTNDTQVEVAIDEGAFASVPFDRLPFGYGDGSVISFQPPSAGANVFQDGRIVRVRVTGTQQGSTYEWTTVYTDCDG